MIGIEGLGLPGGLELRRGPAGLTLAGDGMRLTCDFRELLPRVRAGQLERELQAVERTRSAAILKVRNGCTRMPVSDPWLEAQANVKLVGAVL